MRRIHARETTVEKISEELAQEFIEKFHRQGSLKSFSARRSVALMHHGEIVAVAQFGTPRTPSKKEKYTTELLRLCFAGDTRIPGGASKLIHGYIKFYNPRDMFTYQDMNGDQTSVYEHCGFTLVNQYPKKSLLLAPGTTMETADRKKNEVYTVRTAATLGPDILLGTNLGQKFHDNGSRFTNIQLFVDVLGWTRVEVAGDRVYEWINPNYTYYTYRITATDSDKYYYGVSSIHKPKATIQDCLQHDYYGSGDNTNSNNKFTNWKKKHKNTLRKEVLHVFTKRADAYTAEKVLVGDLWKNDPQCLNSFPGGNYTGSNPGWVGSVQVKQCPTHGMVKHRGKVCCSCTAQKSVTMDDCPVHGTTKFQGGTCAKCSTASTNTMKHCPTHGTTAHLGEHCRKCVNNSAITMKECPAHGMVKHQGGTCSTCNAMSQLHEGSCPVHGTTTFIGEKCRKCISSRQDKKKTCPTHGPSIHRGDSCMKCTSYKGAHNKGKHKIRYNDSCPLCKIEQQSIKKNDTASEEDKEHNNGTQNN